MSTHKYIISALSALLLPAAALAQQSDPTVDYLYNNSNKAYFQIDPVDEQLEALTIDIYDDVRSFIKVATFDLLASDLESYAVPGLENVYGFPLPNKSNDDVIVYQLKYKYAGSDAVTGRLYEGNDPFVYMTDLPQGPITTGWSTAFLDQAYGGGGKRLTTTTRTYGKGYGIHGPGSVETPTNLDLSQFSRFRADVGGHVIDNPTRSNLVNYILYNGKPYAALANTGNVSWRDVIEWDYPLIKTEPGSTIRISLGNGGDGNTNEVICIGAPRFYYGDVSSAKEPQTVVFDNPGGTIFDDNPEVTITAYATGGTRVSYSIKEGAEYATLEGNVLRPKDGCNGEVVVEAVTLGDRTHAAASATVTYNFRFGPAVEYLYTHKHGEDNTAQTMYLYVNPKERQLEKLVVDVYDNVRAFNKITTIDFLANGLSTYSVPELANVYGVPLTVPGGGTIVHRLTYKFAGEDEVVGQLREGDAPFVYMTDLPRGPISVGWSVPYYDKAYNGTERLRNSKYDYGKGYGVHAGGYVETPSSLDLSQFSRFCVDVSGQVISNPTRGRLGFALYNGVSQPYLNTGNVAWSNVYEWDFTLQSTGVGKTVKIAFTDGGDGNTNDIVCIGAPRFYYNFEKRLPQSIDWVEEEIINDYIAFKRPLTAVASSGLPIIYRLIKGAEYARIENGNILSFYNIPSEGEVVVEAFQPGSKDYEPSEVRTCTFRIRRALIIKANERVELEGGHDIDELVVYANVNTAGQAVVKGGIVNVKKLVVKYNFVPGQWNYMAFPSDLDFAVVSDLAAKGFTAAVEEGTPGTYVLREYNEQLRATQPDQSPWTSVTSGKVKGLKGYIMKLEADDDSPVEISFTIDNVALDFDNTMRVMNLSLDMTKCEPETRHTVYIRPTNVKGNTLRVDVRYVPSADTELPINHERALQAMRVTRAQDGKSIRLTLPDQTPARVVIYDRKGSKVLKAINYVSPMKIDVSDLKRGKYHMVVLYGPACAERTLEL